MPFYNGKPGERVNTKSETGETTRPADTRSSRVTFHALGASRLASVNLRSG